MPLVGCHTSTSSIREHTLVIRTFRKLAHTPHGCSMCLKLRDAARPRVHIHKLRRLGSMWLSTILEYRGRKRKGEKKIKWRTLLSTITDEPCVAHTVGSKLS
jgi:hypothetical protein